MEPDRATRGLPLRRLWRDQRAATAVEYGLIIAMIVIAMVAALSNVANVTSGIWNSVSTKVVNAR